MRNLAKWFTVSTLLLLSTPSLATWDNQPTPDATCPITDTRSTQNGAYIGVRNYGCVLDGVNVVWSVSVPNECVWGGCGLIVDIHGATMNAEWQNNGSKLRQYGMNARSYGGRTAYVVLQPNLTDFIDDNIGLDPGSVFGDAYSREIPSILSFVDNAISAFKIDQSRVHMYGFSRGTHTANEFYCKKKRQKKYASFAMHGEKLKCNIQKNKPLLMVNGHYDWMTPNQQYTVNPAIMNKLRWARYYERVLHSDYNWKGLYIRGRHEHRRFTKGKRWFESIEHSGNASLAGHCHPVLNDADFFGLRCLANFDIGEKIIRFFIAHPLKG